MAELAGRELLMASGLKTFYVSFQKDNASDEPEFDVTIQASESGLIDLSRLQLSAIASLGHKKDCEVPKQWPVDILALTKIKDFRIYTTLSLLRGQDPVAPAVVFSPFRQYGAIRPGVWRLETGNMVKITLALTRALAPACKYCQEEGCAFVSFSAAAPFEPENRRDLVLASDVSSRGGTYAGSSFSRMVRNQPLLPTGDGTSWADLSIPYLVWHEVRITFDQTGMADLSSLQLLYSNWTPVASSGAALKPPQKECVEPSEDECPEPSQDETPTPSEDIATAFIDAVRLPTREQLIVGRQSSALSESVAAPAATFASFGRRFDWVNFGLLDVANDNAVVLDIRYISPDQPPENPTDEMAPSRKRQPPQFVAGMQFYPRR